MAVVVLNVGYGRELFCCCCDVEGVIALSIALPSIIFPANFFLIFLLPLKCFCFLLFQEIVVGMAGGTRRQDCCG